MDEPFGALDAQTRNILQEQLLDIWQKEKKKVLFVTHNVDEAVFLADRVIVMTAAGPHQGDHRYRHPSPQVRTETEVNKVRNVILKSLFEEVQKLSDH